MSAAADSSVSRGSVFSFDGLSLGAKRDSKVAIEAYLYATQIRLEAAFLPDRCQEQQILLKSLPRSSTPSSISRIDLPLISMLTRALGLPLISLTDPRLRPPCCARKLSKDATGLLRSVDRCSPGRYFLQHESRAAFIVGSPAEQYAIDGCPNGESSGALF